MWRHPDFFQYKAFIHAGLPRVTCPVHGARKPEDHTGAEAIGIDETSRRGRNHITAVADPAEHDVTDVPPPARIRPRSNGSHGISWTTTGCPNMCVRPPAT